MDIGLPSIPLSAMGVSEPMFYRQKKQYASFGPISPRSSTRFRMKARSGSYNDTGIDGVLYKVISNQQRTGMNMKNQSDIDWYVMFLILLLMLWSIVPVYVSYSLHHG